MDEIQSRRQAARERRIPESVIEWWLGLARPQLVFSRIEEPHHATGRTRICRRCSTLAPRHGRSSSGSLPTLEEALSAPNDTLTFIEAIMDPFDAPTGVINSGNNGADIDYGPRGPQHRDGMLIRPTA
jgi:hypothetical protein